MLKQLRKDIKERNIIYTAQEVDNIYDKLLPLTQVTDEQKEKHIENIQNKIQKQSKKSINPVSITEKVEDNQTSNTVSIEETNLYKELKKYRLERSKTDGVKPYFIYSNVQLEEITTNKPKTIEELKSIKGFADLKCQKYGEDILNIVVSNLE